MLAVQRLQRLPGVAHGHVRLEDETAGDRAVQPQRAFLVAGEAGLQQRFDIEARNPAMCARKVIPSGYSGAVLMVNVPAHDRPRERLLTAGAPALGDRELLAVLLGTGGAAGVGAQELAERLLAVFGSLPAVSRATAADLQRVRGIGATKAARLVAAFEVARRAAAEPTPKRIGGSADIAAVVAPLLKGHSRERLLVVSCSSGLRVLGIDMISEGAVDETLFPVREIMVAVLRRDGRRFALAHNHPSGDPTPSRHDIQATRLVEKAATVAGLAFLDHVIVSDTEWSRTTKTAAKA